eukprot:UN30646
MYPHMDAMLKIVCPREQLAKTADMEDWSVEKLRDYQRAVRFWKTMWFIQRHRHWVTQCKVSEIPGRRENQTFWRAPPLSIPIRANVLQFDWRKFIDSHKLINGRMFDVIVTDPPWTLATEKCTRGVALNYDQITDDKLLKAVPWGHLLEDRGVLMVWVINAKVTYTIKFLKSRGFKLVESMTWLKMSSKRLLARGHGYYLQHAKEECIIAVKGDTSKFRWDQFTLNFAAEKRCQSQKPAAFYDTCESL